jgi:DnaJ-class molecular chaperone
MVCTAAPIHAAHPPTTYDIACDGGGASGRTSARACKLCGGSGRGLYTVQKQPPTPTIQPSAVAIGCYSCPTRIREPK